MLRLRTIPPLSMLLASLIVLPALSEDLDHDLARKALEAGEVLPLRTIIEKLEQNYPGQILEVELDHDDGEWIYEIKLLRDKGVLVRFKFDAGDGTMLGIEGRDIAPNLAKERKP